MGNIILKNAQGTVIKSIPAETGKTLLKQLEDAGAQIPYACLTGMCSACMCEVETGLDQVDKSYMWEAAFPIDDTEVMTCIAGVKDLKEDITLKLMF